MLRSSTIALLACGFLIAGASVAHAASPSLLTKPSLEDADLVAPEPTDPGSLTGIAYGAANTGGLPWGAPLASLSIEVSDANGAVVDSAVTDGGGVYSVSGLAEGVYSVTATDSDSGASSSYAVEVASGVVSRLNFVADERQPDLLIPFPAASWQSDSDPNADTNGNGIVDLDDLAFIREQLGAQPTLGSDDADLNDDGVVDNGDIAVVQASFGRAVLSPAGLFSASVEPGGSTCSVANGAVAVSSLDGHTTGSLSSPSPGVVRFSVLDDSGLANSDLLGVLSFDDDESNPSWVDISLDDGRILGGEVGLVINGEALADPLTGRGSVSAGYVAFREGGFERYRLVGVTGDLNVGGNLVAYSCDEGNEKKANLACAVVVIAAGNALCNWGGRGCAAGNPVCAKNGKCGACRFVTRTYYSVRDPNRVLGTKCTGCSCF